MQLDGQDVRLEIACLAPSFVQFGIAMMKQNTTAHKDDSEDAALASVSSNLQQVWGLAWPAYSRLSQFLAALSEDAPVERLRAQQLVGKKMALGFGTNALAEMRTQLAKRFDELTDAADHSEMIKFKELLAAETGEVMRGSASDPNLFAGSNSEAAGNLYDAFSELDTSLNLVHGCASYCRNLAQSACAPRTSMTSPRSSRNTNSPWERYATTIM